MLPGPNITQCLSVCRQDYPRTVRHFYFATIKKNQVKPGDAAQLVESLPNMYRA